MATTMWAVVGGDVVSFEVERTARNEVGPALEAVGGDAGQDAFFVDLVAGNARWAVSTAMAEMRIGGDVVPGQVRAAVAEALPTWAGRHCAADWHEQGPSEIEAGTTYSDWRMRECSGLPARGDVDFLEGAFSSLLDREPTAVEQRAFGDALCERLFDLSPVASSDEA